MNAKKRLHLNDDEIDAIFEEIRMVACDLRPRSGIEREEIAFELLVELQWITRIVHDIERELSRWVSGAILA